MTQQEKAREVLDRLFRQPRYTRIGLSEKFLREYAATKWVGKDEPLNPEVLIDEAEARVLAGELLHFNRSTMVFYKPPAKREPMTADQHKTQKEQPGSSLATGPQLL